MTKQVTRYEIRAYNSGLSTLSLSPKLRTYHQACKLVKRLKKTGVDAYKAPMKINASAA